MDNERKTGLTEEQKEEMKKHQANFIAYTITTLFGIIMATILIPNFVKLKKNADFGPERFPYIVAGIFVLLGVCGLVMEITAMRKAGLKFTPSRIDAKAYLTQLLLVVSGFAFIALAKTLGFLPAAIIFAFGMLILFGSRNWKFNIVFAIVYASLIFVLFSKILGIRFTGGFVQL